jgi:hypothetical protein
MLPRHGATAPHGGGVGLGGHQGKLCRRECRVRGRVRREASNSLW